MSEKKDNWEKLINLPDEYEHDPTIAQRAIEQIKREQAQKQLKENWFKKHWRSLAVSLASVAVVLAVFIPVYHSLNLTPPNSGAPIYYEEKELTVTLIEDVKSFVEEQNLSIKYFDDQIITTHGAVVTETNEFAYLKQEMLYIGADGFDQVVLYSVAMTNAEFDFEGFFNDLNKELTLSNINVDYVTKAELDAANQIIQARFTYETAEYYLELTTAGDAEAKIEQYVTLLIG